MRFTNENVKHQFVSIVTVAFTLFTISISSSFAGEWLHDFQAAQKLAQDKDVPLLVHFHASWCAPCKQMEQTVLSTQTLKNILGKRIIGVKIDSDQYPQLVDRFNVKSLPSDILLTPTGTIITRAGGMQQKHTYLSFLGRGASRYENDRRVYLARKSKQELMARKQQESESVEEESIEIEVQEGVEEKTYVATDPA